MYATPRMIPVAVTTELAGCAPCLDAKGTPIQGTRCPAPPLPGTPCFGSDCNRQPGGSG